MTPLERADRLSAAADDLFQRSFDLPQGPLRERAIQACSAAATRAGAEACTLGCVRDSDATEALVAEAARLVKQAGGLVSASDALSVLARTGRVDDAGLDAEARVALRAAGARVFAGPGPAWWAVGQRRQQQLFAAVFESAVPLRPDPDAEAFDGPRKP